MATDLNLEELKQRLRDGDYLEISTGGGAYEVWAEPLGNPPSVYYEGEQHPLAVQCDLEGTGGVILVSLPPSSIPYRWARDQRHSP